MGMTMTLFQVEQKVLENTIENSETLFEINQDEKCDSLNIDKSWCGIKFLLSQGFFANQDSTISKIISSGQSIGELDKYDIYEVNYLTASQVKECIGDLEVITKNQLHENFDFEAMNKKEVFLSPFDENAFDYLFDNFQQVRDFYINAAENNNAVITYIS